MKAYKIISLVALFGLISCGGNSGGGSSDTASMNQEMSEMKAGNYYGVLRPVNIKSNGFIPYGAATFTLSGDELKVSVSVDDDQPVTHRQSVHLGTRCPSMGDDMNGDGLVDYNEALNVVGKVVMPLDDDLNSQSKGGGIYPKGRGMTYYKSASLERLHTDLWMPDESGADEVAKLPKGVSMGLEGRVVLVHGTAAQMSFPAGLASYPGEAPHLSLPILCTVLRKIE